MTRILLTGVCGFVGTQVAMAVKERLEESEVYGLDNFSRPGSETNRASLQARGVHVAHGDIRSAADLEGIPEIDWVIDAAANPSVLAGVDGRTSSRQVVENNLTGTVNLLELCRRRGAGMVLLSTSRVYSIPSLAALPMEVHDHAFRPRLGAGFPPGVSSEGIAEAYSCAPPVSLYGATKVASEVLALEYGEAFDFPVWIDRCGVLAGAGQFGRPDQGIFAYWVHSWAQQRELAYIGFDGAGHQVRDCLHPADLARLVLRQIQSGEPLAATPRIVNVSGGSESALSLRQMSRWCADRFGPREVGTRAENRPFDIPWVVLDARLARKTWDWSPTLPVTAILEEIAVHAERHPEWLDLSSGGASGR